MYASAIPIALGWLLLWNPPAWPQLPLLLWVFATAVIVRTAVSAYEVPSGALTAELTPDYDDRTRIVAWRFLFGWSGGLVMLVIAYSFFLVPTMDEPNGLLNRDGYRAYAVTGAIVMLAAILISAMGTHREIPRLPQPAGEPVPIRQMFREFCETVRNHAFVILMAAGLCAYAAQGITFALSNYFYSFVWRFPASAFLWLGGVLFAGVVIAFAISPRVARALGKRRAASLFMLVTPVFVSAPYLLRLAGLFPVPGDPALLPILFATLIAGVAASVSSLVIGTSMMADVVEHSESKTGRRSEGIFAAGNFFVQKTTGGIGIFVASGILSLAGFPAKAQPGAVPLETLDRLTILFCIVVFGISWTAAWLYAKFPFGREEYRVIKSGHPASLAPDRL
jgi:glycoside/pentoside/hexuronide:cation symporter, GPH family